ncbi:MAG: hypothetical protein WA323_01075 [Candidatus Nitrosopolaris sp.]
MVPCTSVTALGTYVIARYPLSDQTSRNHNQSIKVYMAILVIAGKRLMLFVVNDPRILPIVTRTLKDAIGETQT